MNKHLNKSLLILGATFLLSGCSFNFGNNSGGGTATDDSNVSGSVDVDTPSVDIEDEEDATATSSESYTNSVTSDTSIVKIVLNKTSATITDTNGLVSVSGSIVTITGAGEYAISGTLTNGSIVVEATKDEEITLDFNGIDISSTTTAPINIKSADKTTINLVEGSINKLADATTLVYSDSENEEPNACLFSKDDLTITGKGTLYVNGNFNNGITTKDDLKIKSSPTISVNAKNIGIKGNESVKINGGYYSITSEGDGIKTSSYDEYSSSDTFEDRDGMILIKDGEFTIDSDGDAISASTDLEIDDGTFKITTYTGASTASHTSSDTGGHGGDFGGRPGMGGQGGSSSSSSSSTTESCKGIKAGTTESNVVYGTELIINGGNFTLDTYDDSIHSDHDVKINGGSYNVKSGDDGFHADDNLSFTNCSVAITTCYEGTEGTTVTFNDGANIHISSSDDALNASCGNENDSNAQIIFNSGCYIYANTSGDGIDSNGYVYQNGGTIVVTGPTDGGNGPVDTDLGYIIKGGTLLAMSVSGAMTDANFKNCTQGICKFSTSNISSGSVMCIKDSSSNELITFTNVQSVGLIWFSSANVSSGSSYTLYKGGSSTGDKVDVLYTNGTYSGGSSCATASASTSSSSSGFGR